MDCYKIIKTVNGKTTTVSFHSEHDEMSKELERHICNAFGKIEIIDLRRHQAKETLDDRLIKYKEVVKTCNDIWNSGARCECQKGNHECNVLYCPDIK
jgi:hypothetical protein